MLRLTTWNCRVGAFRKKVKHIVPLRPDVLVAQEVETIDSVLLFAGDCQPTYRDRICDPEFSRRGIGVFSYTDTVLQAVDASDPMYGFRRYEARSADLSFNVVGVWTWATKSSATSYKQVHDGLRRHGDWIQERPTVMLGDFNDNASFKKSNWRELHELVEALGLVSAYHEFFSEPFGAESRPTHFHVGKETATFHLDYCFIPRAWVGHITNVTVGSFGEWRHLSDHMPLTVDLDFQAHALTRY